MANNSKKSFKAFLPVLIVILVAGVVISAFAISGNITKKRDIDNPTVTKVEVVEETEPKQENAKATLVAVGDNLIHNTLISAGEQEDGSLDYNDFYTDMKKYIQGADIAVIDQETILGGKDWEYTGYPVFNSPWEIGEATINAGFDVFLCATNHTLDLGSAGVMKECEFYKKHPEAIQVGAYSSQEDYDNIAYKEVNGIKFAFLNYTNSTNGIPVPEDKPYVVKLLSEDLVKKEVKIARENADVVVVFPHWGIENSHDVCEEQKNYCKLFSELGVDIVIGGHPHVLQPVEWYTNEQTGQKMIVYYSLGNFISHQINLYQMCGGMAEITVERKDGKIEITNAKLAPVIDYYTNTGSKYKFSVYKLSDYNNDLASKQAQSGATVEYFTDLAKSVISDEFLDMN